MTIAYLGNFKYPFCTEVHVALTLEDLGHTVVRLQEDEVSIDQIVLSSIGTDLFLWTRTYGMLRGDGFEMLRRLREVGVKTASFHLDYYYGISRQQAMGADAFWSTDYVFQPDGDHVTQMRDELGINNYWSPPAVYKEGAYLLEGLLKTHEVIFVGTANGYHSEWPWRGELINKLSTVYPQFELYPKGEAVREAALNELYASTKVVVGDSIMADISDYYTTDRIFETTGRGGFIIYPEIKWLVEIFEGNLVTYKPGDWDDLKEKIDYYLDPTNEEEREMKRRACHEITKRSHTYHQRLTKLLETINES